MSTPVPEISPQEGSRLAEAGLVLLLDVREPHEWDSGHAAAARHVPLGDLDPVALADDRPIVTVCRSGARSGQAASALAQAGRDVSNLAGGMTAWAAAGLPVVRSDGTDGTIA